MSPEGPRKIIPLEEARDKRKQQEAAEREGMIAETVKNLSSIRESDIKKFVDWTLKDIKSFVLNDPDNEESKGMKEKYYPDWEQEDFAELLSRLENTRPGPKEIQYWVDFLKRGERTLDLPDYLNAMVQGKQPDQKKGGLHVRKDLFVGWAQEDYAAVLEASRKDH